MITYASVMLEAGMDMHFVKEQLGHADITTTINIYGHLVREEVQDKLAALEAKQFSKSAVTKTSP